MTDTNAAPQTDAQNTPVNPTASGTGADTVNWEERFKGLQAKVNKEYVPMQQQLQAAQAVNTELQQQLNALKSGSTSIATAIEQERTNLAAQLVSAQQQLQAAQAERAQFEAQLKRASTAVKIASVNPKAAELYEKGFLTVPEGKENELESVIKEFTTALQGQLQVDAQQRALGSTPAPPNNVATPQDFEGMTPDQLSTWLKNPANIRDFKQWESVNQIYLRKITK